MYRYDKRLVDRLTNWETVYIEDEDKPEGNLYLEAAERIVELSNELEALREALRVDEQSSCKNWNKIDE